MTRKLLAVHLVAKAVDEYVESCAIFCGIAHLPAFNIDGTRVDQQSGFHDGPRAEDLLGMVQEATA